MADFRIVVRVDPSGAVRGTRQVEGQLNRVNRAGYVSFQLLYAHWMELERDVTRAFVQIIQLMDSAYMDWVDKNKANNNPGPTKGFKVVERK